MKIHSYDRSIVAILIRAPSSSAIAPVSPVSSFLVDPSDIPTGVCCVRPTLRIGASQGPFPRPLPHGLTQPVDLPQFDDLWFNGHGPL